MICYFCHYFSECLFKNRKLKQQTVLTLNYSIEFISFDTCCFFVFYICDVMS